MLDGEYTLRQQRLGPSRGGEAIGYAMRYTKEPIRIVTGVSTLAQILHDRLGQRFQELAVEMLVDGAR